LAFFRFQQRLVKLDLFLGQGVQHLRFVILVRRHIGFVEVDCDPLIVPCGYPLSVLVGSSVYLVLHNCRCGFMESFL
jgi:hypothetical protein